MIVELSITKLTMPNLCACCGRPPETTIKAQRTNGTRKESFVSGRTMIPYCLGCARHVHTFPGRASSLALFVMVLSLGVALVPWLLVRAIRRSRARKFCTPTCIGPGPSVSVLASRGTVTAFEIASHVFAYALIQANPY